MTYLWTSSAEEQNLRHILPICCIPSPVRLQFSEILVLPSKRCMPRHAAPSQPEGFGKVEIKASRRDQKLQSASAPKMQSSHPEAGGRPPGSFPVPSWAAIPPAEAVLQVYKDNKQLDSIKLKKAMTVFGRFHFSLSQALKTPFLATCLC